MRLRLATLFACCALTLAPPATMAAAAGQAAADLPTTAPAGSPVAWLAVDAARLDAARGGFQLPSGLAVGLGIERMVAVNGELVTQTRFDIPDVRLLNVDQAALAREAMASVQLVQNGHASSGEALSSPLPGQALSSLPVNTLPPTLGATLIQNTLNAQQIQSRTVIDASVNTLDGFKALNFSSSVLDALARSAGSR